MIGPPPTGKRPRCHFFFLSFFFSLLWNSLKNPVDDGEPLLGFGVVPILGPLFLTLSFSTDGLFPGTHGVKILLGDLFSPRPRMLYSFWSDLSFSFSFPQIGGVFFFSFASYAPMPLNSSLFFFSAHWSTTNWSPKARKGILHLGVFPSPRPFWKAPAWPTPPLPFLPSCFVEEINPFHRGEEASLL